MIFRLVPLCFLFSLLAFVSDSALAKVVEKDTNKDGRVDQVACFDEQGALISLMVDGDGDGRLERRQHYTNQSLELVEQDFDGDGFWEHRDFYVNATRCRQEVYTPHGKLTRIVHFDAGGRLVRMQRDTDGSGRLDTVCAYVRGQLKECEKDEDGNERWEVRQEFVNGTLTKRLQDKDQDGFAENVILFDGSASPRRSFHDLDGDRFRETVRLYTRGEVVRQEKTTGPGGRLCERVLFAKGQPQTLQRFSGNATLPSEILEFKDGHPVVRKRDTTGDGRMDERVDLDAKGQPLRMEQDTDGNGKVDRISLFTNGSLASQRVDENHDGFFETTIRLRKEKPVRMERDTDRDEKPEVVILYDDQGRTSSLTMDQSGNGRMDTWQTYENDILQKIRRDTTGNGRVDTEVVFVNGTKDRLVRDADGDGYFETAQYYGRDGWDMVLERDAGKGGHLMARLYYRDGALRKKEQLAPTGEAEFVEWFDASGMLVKSREQEPGGGYLTWLYGEDGEAVRAERDEDRDGRSEEIFWYEKGILARVEEDGNRDGRVDIWEYFDASEALICRKEDLDHDGTPDLIKENGMETAAVSAGTEDNHIQREK
jgi:antitoxin component YwqK of YwqJK toxin-antitoxin module